jgi:hypothetical protein
LRREGEVELQAAGHEEDAIDARPGRQVEQEDAAELLLDRLRPVREHVESRNAFGDAEREVEIGPAVSAARRERADGRAGDDAVVRLGELEHPRANTVPVGGGVETH